jgi:excisionase family DNA binding protein
MSQTFQKEQQPDFSEWLTKQQVATLLECSTKSVEKFAQEGKLHTTHWRRPGGGPKIAVYHPGDVERLRAARVGDPFVMPAPVNSQQSANLSEKEPQESRILRLFAAILQDAKSQKLLEPSKKSRKPEVPIKDRVYLTMQEAAAYAGLPERRLRRLVADGKLPADREGHMRVRRTDLDKL